MLIIAENSKTTLRVVWEDEEVHTGGTRSGAKDSDPFWVSPKAGNVFIEPTQGLDLVEEAIVPLSWLVACAQKACTTQIKIERERDRQTNRQTETERETETKNSYLCANGERQKLIGVEQHVCQPLELS